jgi:hypothetical protein
LSDRDLPKPSRQDVASEPEAAFSTPKSTDRIPNPCAALFKRTSKQAKAMVVSRIRPAAYAVASCTLS